jgi:4-hydroxybutyrate CoA-transferase
MAPVIDALPAGGRVVLHSGHAQPPVLAEMLAQHAPDLHGVRVLATMPVVAAPYASPEALTHLTVESWMPGLGLRQAALADGLHLMRHTVFDWPALFAHGDWRADVLMLQVSPVDADGRVSLGVSVDFMQAALASARCVVAEINPHMPNTCGDSRFSAERIDWFVPTHQPVQVAKVVAPDAVDQRIAEHVASLVSDGAVVQIGMGSLPEGVLARLGHLRHLGLHTGIFTDGMQALMASGVVDNSTKRFKPGVSVATMAGGSADVYRYLHRNPAVEMHPCDVTHGPQVLAQMDGFCAINSALQVDLSGCVNAEWVGSRRISLPGGLPNFAQGAMQAKKGMAIIAMRSVHGPDQRSSIVAQLAAHGPAALQGQDYHCLVTEHGVAHLHGLSPRARAQAIARVAHPLWRDALMAQAQQWDA